MDIGCYRSELKYVVGYDDYLSIRQRVRPLMKIDSHASGDGHYTVRSIYFDNISDKALREKIYGTPLREKFRIRYYNDDLSFITLEKKLKRNDLCAKYCSPLTKEESLKLLLGDTGRMSTHPEPLVRELYAKMKSSLLRPRVQVSYSREAYEFAAGNVRITFDSDIRTSLFHQTFLDGDMPGISAADTPGQIVLEIKFSGFLPDIVSDLVRSDGIRRTSFSKYIAARRFG